MDSQQEDTPVVRPAASKPGVRRNSSRRYWIWVLLVVIAASLAGWWGWTRYTKRQSEAANSGSATSATAAGAGASRSGGGGTRGGRFGGAGANAAQPVSVQTVSKRDIKVTVDSIGTINASNTAIVRAQVSGVLRKINFVEGQQVKAGQVLAEIDARVYQAAVAQAEGALDRDKAQLEDSRLDLARYKDLLAKDAIPKQQLDTQGALARQLEGTVKVDQAVLDNAKLQLSYTKVVAPISGRVGLKQVDLGNLVQTSDANGLVSIAQTRPVSLVFAVPSANVPVIVTRMHSGEAVPIEARERGGVRKLADGVLATLDNAIDTTTDTIKLKASFPNQDDLLFPNQSVRVVMQVDTARDVIAVPQPAVQRGAQGFYVYVLDDQNKVQTRVVKPGVTDGTWTAVDGNLQPGEKVVIDGADRLREGATVQVIDPSAAASAPSARPSRRASGPRPPRQ